MLFLSYMGSQHSELCIKRGANMAAFVALLPLPCKSLGCERSMSHYPLQLWGVRWWCLCSPTCCSRTPQVAMETSRNWGKWQFVMPGCRRACEAEQMSENRSLLLSHGHFVRVTLETKIFQFPVGHLEQFMAWHVFLHYRCAVVGLFLHVLSCCNFFIFLSITIYIYTVYKYQWWSNSYMYATIAILCITSSFLFLFRFYFVHFHHSWIIALYSVSDL